MERYQQHQGRCGLLSTSLTSQEPSRHVSPLLCCLQSLDASRAAHSKWRTVSVSKDLAMWCLRQPVSASCSGHPFDPALRCCCVCSRQAPRPAMTCRRLPHVGGATASALRRVCPRMAHYPHHAPPPPSRPWSRCVCAYLPRRRCCLFLLLLGVCCAWLKDLCVSVCASG